MKIAYVSYEHPLGIAGGGIGTYIGQIAKVMANRGHEVEVFSGHHHQNKTLNIDGYNLHLIKSNNIVEYRALVLNKFRERHAIINFEIIESAEYGADALLIKKKFQHLPLTVKLHTPTFLVTKLNRLDLTLLKKIRYIIGGVIRGKIVKRYWVYSKANDVEYQLFQMADSICSPSNSLKKIIDKNWGKKAISVIPNVFDPSPDLILETKKNDDSFNVVFVGKLEIRKGILDLINAIRTVVKIDEGIKFKFIGLPLASPKKNIRMDKYILSKLKMMQGNIEFVGFVPNDEIDVFLKQSDVCVIPSLWENFPTVCLEAMAAGICVVGTNNGGMADIIEDQKTGILIPPNSPAKLAEAILTLKKDSVLRKTLAINGKKSILQKYNGQVIGNMVENFYERTIQKN